MHKRLVATLILVLSCVSVLGGGGSPAGAATSLPPGFADVPVANVSAPTALAFTPDGRMLITTQPGQVRVVEDGDLLGNPALDLAGKICTESERGLLGIAVDPFFETNHFLYLYYTFKKGGSCPFSNPDSPVNRTSRFVLGNNNVIDPASEKVLVDNIPSPGGNHNGGDVHIGKDNNLYISVGDGGCDYAGGGCGGGNDASRDQQVLLGKILRIRRNGSIPSDNPFLGANSDRCNAGGTVAGHTCQETFAWGLRNPFRFAMDPDATGTEFRIDDVGQDTWEEIDQGVAGADYGWNVREGHCANGSTTDCGAPPPGMTNPIFDYVHSGGCGAITGGAFVPNGVWPSEYDGDYLFVDFNCGTMYRLEPDGGGGYTRTTFGTGFGASAVVSIVFGPYGSKQALYYTTYGSGGQVRRISYSANPPTAALSGNPTNGQAPLLVHFDASASTDPDGDPLTYEWRFGDGQTATTSTPTIDHTYTVAGDYKAIVGVRDPLGNAASAKRPIHVT